MRIVRTYNLPRYKRIYLANNISETRIYLYYNNENKLSLIFIIYPNHIFLYNERDKTWLSEMPDSYATYSIFDIIQITKEKELVYYCTNPFDIFPNKIEPDNGREVIIYESIK